MKKTTKTTVSWIAVLTLLLSLLPQTIFAEGEAAASELTATVTFIDEKHDDQTLMSKTVTVLAEPEKPYIPEGAADPLDGKASVYDALLTALGAENITAEWGSYGMFVTALTIDGQTIANAENTDAVSPFPAYKEFSLDGKDYYYSYSRGYSWMYGIEGLDSGTLLGMSSQPLTDNANITFNYQFYQSEYGTYKINVIFAVEQDGKWTETSKDIPVPVYVYKDYLQDVPDDMKYDKASAYDALLVAAGKENVSVEGLTPEQPTLQSISSITLNGKQYSKTSAGAPDGICDSLYTGSTGMKWNVHLNPVEFGGENTEEIFELVHDDDICDRYLKYGDQYLFTYEPWSDMKDEDNNPYELPYGIGKMKDQNGNVAGDDFSGVTDVFVTAAKFTPYEAADVILAAYDENGVCLGTNITNLSPEQAVMQEINTNLFPLPQGTKQVKAFAWSRSLRPLSVVRSAESK